MWGTLRADFTEFVSTVTSDAAETLTALDVTLDATDNDDNNDPMESDTMIDLDTGMVIRREAPSPPPPPPLTDVEEIRTYLCSLDSVFLEELSQEETNEEAAVEFDLDAKTEDIATLLANDEALEAAFSRLTDQVEYKEFWKRYYHRFAQERLSETYHYYYYQEQQRLADQEEEERNQTSTSGLGLGALKGVTSFLGGAVKRMIKEDIDDDDDDKDGDQGGEDDDDDDDNKQGGTGHFFNTAHQTGVNAMSFFKGSAVRPPFVLNTAVSEDEEGDDDEEEEEELGWDDDDEDEDDNGQDGNGKENEGDDDEEDNREGQIEFKDAEKERMQEQLDQALTERDMLHKTVELQTEEIKRLKEGVASVSENKQVEALKMQLFEKDSELAALRARLEDEGDRDEDDEDRTGSSPSSTAELEALRNQLSLRDSQMTQLQQELQAVKEELAATRDNVNAGANEVQQQLITALSEVEAKKSELLQAKSETLELEGKLKTMMDCMGQLKSENDTLRLAQEEAGSSESQADVELASAREALAQLRLQLDTLSSQNMTLQQELDSEKSNSSQLNASLATMQLALESNGQELTKQNSLVQSLQMELDSTKEELAKTNTIAALPTHPSSPGSSSTGVKVATPPPPVMNEVEELAPLQQPELPKAAAAAAVGNSGEDDDSDWGDW